MTLLKTSGSSRHLIRFHCEPPRSCWLSPEFKGQPSSQAEQVECGVGSRSRLSFAEVFVVWALNAGCSSATVNSAALVKGFRPTAGDVPAGQSVVHLLAGLAIPTPKTAFVLSELLAKCCQITTYEIEVVSRWTFGSVVPTQTWLFQSPFPTGT